MSLEPRERSLLGQLADLGALIRQRALDLELGLFGAVVEFAGASCELSLALGCVGDLGPCGAQLVVLRGECGGGLRAGRG